MDIDLNILYKNVFGYVGLPFPIGEINLNPFSGTENVFRKDLLGRPVPMPVQLNGTELPNAVISLTGKKTVVETPLTGSEMRGSVKELVSVDDYKIQIRGIIVNTENESYPEDYVLRIRELCEARESVLIDCPVCELFDIAEMVITDFSLPEVRGLHFQAYEINGLSDDDFTTELLLENQN